MPDLFDPLKGTPDPLVRAPLSAEEVRHRGDRLRRRRRVLAAAGASVVAALVVGVGATFAGNLTAGPTPAPATGAPSYPPEPSKTPVSPTSATSDPVTWRTEIPEGFPLDLGLPQVRFSEQDQVGPGAEVAALPTLTACDRAVPMATGALDRLGVRWWAPEDVRSRQLYTYEDPETAEARLEGIVDLFRRCPQENSDDVPTSGARNDVREVSVGDEGYVVVRTFGHGGLPTPGLELVHVVRVGNALLLSLVSNEGGAGPEGPEPQVREELSQVDALVEEMCGFAESGC